MSEKRARRMERLRAADTEQSHRAVTTPRDPREDIHLPGAGWLLYQVISMPSFDPCTCFDVRREASPDDDLKPPERIERVRLYVANGVTPGDRRVVGYRPLEAPGGLLLNYLERIRSLAIVTDPLKMATPVFDGTVVELAFTTGMAELRVRWQVENPPPGWRELDRLAADMLEKFRRLSRTC